MRILSTHEILQVSGASPGNTAAEGAAGYLGGELGASAGALVGLPIVGGAIGAGLGALAGDELYESAGEEAMEMIQYWRSGSNGFMGASFFPQTPN